MVVSIIGHVVSDLEGIEAVLLHNFH
jgi:hypothetical protein